MTGPLTGREDPPRNNKVRRSRIQAAAGLWLVATRRQPGSTPRAVQRYQLDQAAVGDWASVHTFPLCGYGCCVPQMAHGSACFDLRGRTARDKQMAVHTNTPAHGNCERAVDRKSAGTARSEHTSSSSTPRKTRCCIKTRAPLNQNPREIRFPGKKGVGGGRRPPKGKSRKIRGTRFHDFF